MGDHEATPVQGWLVRIGRDVAARAKAWAAGLFVLVAGEVLVALADPAVVAQITQTVPAWVVPYVPALIGALAFGITHAIPNTPKPEADGALDTDEPADS